MKKLLLVVPLFVACIGLSVGGAGAQDEDKDKKVVGALAPHKLDDVFKNARTEKQIVDTLINDPLFKKAVKEALKAKQKQEQAFRNNPALRSSSPAQAARVAFLKTLEDEKQNGVGAAPPKKDGGK